MHACAVGASTWWVDAAGAIRLQDAGLLQQVIGCGFSDRAANTHAVYVLPWERFQAFCGSRVPPYVCVPAQPVVVAMFLAEVAAGASSYACVKRASAAIYHVHRLAGLPDATNPTKHAMCKMVRECSKRVLGTAVVQRKDPLGLQDLLALVEVFAYTGAPVWSVSIAAFAMVCWAGFLRFDDQCGVLVKDVAVYDTHMEVFVGKAKGDQWRQGNVVAIASGVTGACPVALCNRLVREGGLAPGAPLFQGFDGRLAARIPAAAHLNGRAITYAQVKNWLLKGVAKVRGISTKEATACFGLHSLRSGGASGVAAVLAKENIPEHVFQMHGRWRSREAMLGYIERQLDPRLAVTQALGY